MTEIKASSSFIDFINAVVTKKVPSDLRLTFDVWEEFQRYSSEKSLGNLKDFEGTFWDWLAAQKGGEITPEQNKLRARPSPFV